MVVKAIISAIGKSKTKPKPLEKVIKSRKEADTLLGNAQKKIEEIKAGKADKLDP